MFLLDQLVGIECHPIQSLENHLESRRKCLLLLLHAIRSLFQLIILLQIL